MAFGSGCVNADTSARMSFILVNASFSGGPNSSVLAEGLWPRSFWSKTWCNRQQLWKAVITGVTDSYPRSR